MATWDSAKAAESEAKAENELQLMVGTLKPVELEGARKIMLWMKKWYNGTLEGDHATGWKALARIFVKVLK